jgi:hypothetical protein
MLILVIVCAAVALALIPCGLPILIFLIKVAWPRSRARSLDEMQDLEREPRR